MQASHIKWQSQDIHTGTGPYFCVPDAGGELASIKLPCRSTERIRKCQPKPNQNLKWICLVINDQASDVNLVRSLPNSTFYWRHGQQIGINVVQNW